jgi:archaellum component FlaC
MVDMKIDAKKIRGIFSDISKASEKVVGSVTINPQSRMDEQKKEPVAEKLPGKDRMTNIEDDIEDLSNQVRKLSRRVRRLEDEYSDHK